jgi:hypothetical protein
MEETTVDNSLLFVGSFLQNFISNSKSHLLVSLPDLFAPVKMFVYFYPTYRCLSTFERPLRRYQYDRNALRVSYTSFDPLKQV